MSSASEQPTPTGRCDGCGHEVPALELVDVAAWVEFTGARACGSCRGRAVRAGRITRGEMLRRRGARPEKVRRMEALEQKKARRTEAGGPDKAP